VIEKSTLSANEGINAVAEVVASFEAIVNNINNISSIVSQITTISEEQLDSISAVNDSINNISKVVLDNSATAEESAAVSQELNAHAELMKQKIAFFTLKK